jgi:hypothetical protein
LKTDKWVSVAQLKMKGVAEDEANWPELLAIKHLCFDREGDCFAAEAVILDGVDLAGLDRARVWWNVGGNFSGPEHIGKCSTTMPYDLAISLGNPARLAVSYCENSPQCVAEVVKVGGGGTARSAKYVYALNGLGVAWIAMDAQGRYLVARDHDKVYLWELFEGHAKLIRSWSEPFDDQPFPTGWTWWQAIDISRDGSLAAYVSYNHVKVIHIPDCKQVRDIAVSDVCYAITISPDGRLLAIADKATQTICFYRIGEDMAQ